MISSSSSKLSIKINVTIFQRNIASKLVSKRFCTQQSTSTTAASIPKPKLLDVEDYNECCELIDGNNYRLITKESTEYGESFIPTRNDILLLTPPRSGTIWTGYITHLLKTKCNLNNISNIKETEDFMPLVPACLDYDILINNNDCNDKNYYQPEYMPPLLMHHGYYENVIKSNNQLINNDKCKIIIVMREPKDAIYSWYKRDASLYLKDNLILNFDAFFDTLIYKFPSMPAAINVLEFYQSWAPFYNENNFKYYSNNVLTIFYEDLIADRKECIKKIAQFTGLGTIDNDNNSNDGSNNNIFNNSIDNELIDNVFKYSSKSEMEKVNIHFGRLVRTYLARQDSVEMKSLHSDHVRKDGGSVGQGHTGIPQKYIEKIDYFWETNVANQIDCENYQQLRERVSFLYN